MDLMIWQLVLVFYVFQHSEQYCKIMKRSLDCKEILYILNFHNEARSKVALGLTEMPEGKDIWVLKWDETLARMAQEWANHCLYKSDKNRPKELGENLSWRASNDFGVIDVEYLTGLWYDEVELYDPEGEGVQGGTEHLTQMVWDDTKFIGCGATIYQTSDDETIYKTLLVCYYRPPGNVEGKKPFEEYEHHARCTRGVGSLAYKGLCAHDSEHSLGNYVPCIGGSDTLRPTTIFTIFLFYGYTNMLFE